MNCSDLVRVAIITNATEVVYENEDGTLTFLGQQGKLLELIIQGLNAQLQLVEADDKQFGQLLSDGNWTGMIGKLQKGLADIAIYYLTVTEERFSAVDYSPTYTTHSITFAIGKLGFRSKTLAFVEAFDTTIWITTLILLLLMPLIFTILLREKGGYPKFILMLASSVLQSSLDHKQDRLEYRILLGSWLIFATILSFSYTAVFFSLLTLPAELKNVQNFQELSEAVTTKGFKLYAPKGSSALEFLLKSEKKYLRELGQNVILNEWYINHVPLPLNAQMDKQSAMIAGRTWLSVSAGPEDWKHFYTSDDSLLSLQLAVVMKKGFCFKRKLINVIHRMNNGGLYEKIENHEAFKLWLSIPERRRIVTRIVRSLSLSDLSGAFFLLAIGLGISIICFLIELLFIRKAWDQNNI